MNKPDSVAVQKLEDELVRGVPGYTVERTKRDAKIDAALDRARRGVSRDTEDRRRK